MTDENVVFEPIKPPESNRLISALREETTGGLLLIVTTGTALLWANSMWSHSYSTFTHFEIGPKSLGLHLPISLWATDFLLAFFFYVIGIELKHEIVHGSLSSVRQAGVPIIAAFCGAFFSLAIFLVFNGGSNVAHAWGIPISTDVAFALAVLAIAGRALPLELRSFLLTVAVVNDLFAIFVIAIFYGQGFTAGYFIASLLFIGLFWLLQRRNFATRWLGLPLAALSWYCMFRSGVHSTIAGVGLGLVMSVHKTEGQTVTSAERAEHLIRPFASGFCVPFFALVSIGVSIAGSSVQNVFTSKVGLGIICGFIIGQPLGITLGAFVTTKLSQSRLHKSLTWLDVAIVGTLASIGFTVALLVTEVSFTHDEDLLNVAKTSIIFSNLIAVIISMSVIRLRKRKLLSP